jgi:hypothetical protein
MPGMLDWPSFEPTPTPVVMLGELPSPSSGGLVRARDLIFLRDSWRSRALSEIVRNASVVIAFTSVMVSSCVWADMA